MSTESESARRMARKFLINGAISLAFVVLLFLCVPLFWRFDDWGLNRGWVLFVAGGFSTACLGFYLCFEALLFRIIGSHEDGVSGGRAIDEFLDRAGLRATPNSPRSLSDRIAGTNRLLMYQRIATLVTLGIFAVSSEF